AYEILRCLVGSEMCIRDRNRSISIPDQDRFWLSAGTTYAFNKDASVDVGVSYMHGQSVKINEGPYQFESEGKAWLFGTNFNYAF
ncbi:outer membrane protein transport protein, partial [Escherichia coli]